MKILINTASTHKGGSVQGALSIIQNLINFNEHQYYIVLSGSVYNLIKIEDYPSNFEFERLDFRPGKNIFNIFKANRFFKELENRFKADIIFTTSGPSYWKPIAPHLIGYNLAHYVYSETPFFNIISFSERLKWKIKGAVIRNFFKRDGQYYVTQTEDITERVKLFLNTENVFTVSNTCNDAFYKRFEKHGFLPNREQSEFRYLSIAAYYKHKNLEFIPKVVLKLVEYGIKNIRFVLTIDKHIYENIIPEELRPYIYNVGPVKVTDCPALYNECDAAFIPTLLECFTASYIESMVMKLPVLTSDLGFAKTICGEAALYFDPVDVDDATRKVSSLATDNDLQEILKILGVKRAERFPNAYERTKSYLNILTRILAQHP